MGFAEALSAPEAIFSLRGAGFQVKPFRRADATSSWWEGGPGVLSPVAVPRPEEDLSGAIAALKAVADVERPAAILALDDASLFLVDRAFGGGSPWGLASETRERAAIALDKSCQIRLAEAAGFQVPRTTVVHGREEISSHEWFPAILKPALAAEVSGNSLRRGGARFLMTRADIARLPPEAELSFPGLVQELVRGDGEGLFGFAAKDGVFAWFAHRRIRMMNPHGSGASASEMRPVDPDLRASAERMMREIGWRGPFMIELLRDEKGTPYFMELNGRLWGSLALSRRAGFEYPAWAVAQALDPNFEPPEFTPTDPGVVRHLGRELLHLLFVLRGPKSKFHKEEWPRILPALTKVLRPARPSRFYNWDPDQKWGFLRDAFQTVAAALRRSS